MLIITKLLFIGFFAAMMQATSQTSSPTKSQLGIECIADMQLPVYRGIVWHAGITGTVKATIILGSNAKPLSINVQAAHPGLSDFVKRSLMTATFVGRCADQAVGMTFAYKLVGGPDAEPGNEIRLRDPSTFEITAHPSIPITEPALKRR